VTEEKTTRIRLDVSYDGTAFFGWGTQPTLRTVQGVLETALATIFRAEPRGVVVTVAGRTDAGVHATGQVAHVDLTDEQLVMLARSRQGSNGAEAEARDPAEKLARRLNGIAGLESDVWVRRSSTAAPGFDARFSATWRRYEYRLSDAAGPRNPLVRNHVVWYPGALDLVAMQAAASSLLGLHDWASYCKPREGASTIRTLEHFAWRREPDGTLIAELRADAFCHSMVRALVGVTVAIGDGKLPVSSAVELRNDLARTSAFKVMPAKGLVLAEVGYPADDELGARAELTRRMRGRDD
jgi:tRNA pseudouridine38-40 synthase